MKTPYLTHPNFQTHGAGYGFFTRNGGVSNGNFSSLNCGLGSGDLLDYVSENHRRIAGEFNVDAQHLLFCKQIHCDKVITVNEPWQRAMRPEADAMVTNQTGIALAVMSADCTPVLFYEPNAKIIGAAHSGWKGAIGGVIEQTIAAIELLGGQTSAIHACIGPCIQFDSYEVGPEFPAAFLAQDTSNDVFFKPSTRDKHFMFNLPAYIEKRLALRGITQIHNLNLDTVSNEERFFSYRRKTLRGDLQNGVQMSAICLD